MIAFHQPTFRVVWRNEDPKPKAKGKNLLMNEHIWVKRLYDVWCISWNEGNYSEVNINCVNRSNSKKCFFCLYRTFNCAQYLRSLYGRILDHTLLFKIYLFVRLSDLLIFDVALYSRTYSNSGLTKSSTTWVSFCLLRGHWPFSTSVYGYVCLATKYKFALRLMIRMQLLHCLT